MSFKNGIKLIIAKFSLVWSVLLYTVLVTVVIGAILYGLWYPTFHAMADQGFFAAIGDVFTDFMVGEEHFMKVIETIGEVITEIGATILSYPASVVLTPVVLLVVGRLAYGFKDVAVCACLDAHMSSNMKYGFWSALVANVRRSAKLVLSRSLFTLPFDALIFGAVWATGLIFSTIGIWYLTPFLAILEWVALVPLKKLFFLEWSAYIATEHNHTFSAMRRGVRLGMKYRGRIYSTLFVTEVLGLALNVLVGVFTLGAGLVVTIPVTLTFELVLSMTVLYNHIGRRYYLENGNIFIPEGTPVWDLINPDVEKSDPASFVPATGFSADTAGHKVLDSSATALESGRLRMQKPPKNAGAERGAPDPTGQSAGVSDPARSIETTAAPDNALAATVAKNNPKSGGQTERKRAEKQADSAKESGQTEAPPETNASDIPKPAKKRSTKTK